MVSGDYPVDDALTVLRGEDVYQTGEWRKSIIQYYLGDENDSVETAIYLWHKDDDRGWTRKNKYAVKTLDAWEEDQDIIEAVKEAPTDEEADDSFPVSDYYTVGAGETVFKTDSWWKAIVRIEAKGEYETEEYNIYVWQHQDEKWRRRQKYAIKSYDDWEDERAIVSQLLTDDVTIESPGSAAETDGETAPGEAGGLDITSGEEKHLSKGLTDGW